MTPRSPGAFLLSAVFHAVIIGFVLLFGYYANQSERVKPRILELVAGEGDNYGATVAPKLGTPGGVKVDLPTPPIPKPVIPEPQPEPEPQPATPRPAPAPPEPPPVTKPPPQAVTTPAPAPKQPEKKTLTPKQQILRNVWRAQDKGKKEAAKERAAEEKRLKKEEFDRQQRERAKVASGKASSTKVPHIDGEGIAKGVIGGSAENKIGGAGGKALVAGEGAVTERYFAMLKQRVQNALDKPPGISDDLAVTVVVHISASGRLSGARVVKSSGSEEFDRAVIAAFSRVTMPEHPEKKNEDLELIFRTKDVGEG